jgi:hypothetical protein
VVTADRPSNPPVLADPGYGRTWEADYYKPTRYSKKRWTVSLISRERTLVGYIAHYHDGWGAGVIARGKNRMVKGTYETPQAAADALLKARKTKKGMW